MTKILQGGVVADGSSAGQVLRELAQNMAAERASNVTDLTDNSSGTSGSGTVAAISDVTAFTVTGTDLAPKSGFDTALGAIRDALKTLHTQVDTIATDVGVDLGFTYSGGGSDGSGTISAVTTDLTAVDGSLDGGLAFAGTNDIITAYRNALYTLTTGVNKLRVATGQSEITNNIDGAFDSTIATLATTTGAGVDGTSDSGVEETDAEASLDSMVNAVATLAEALNDITGSDANLTVVAGK